MMAQSMQHRYRYGLHHRAAGRLTLKKLTIDTGQPTGPGYELNVYDIDNIGCVCIYVERGRDGELTSSACFVPGASAADDRMTKANAKRNRGVSKS